MFKKYLVPVNKIGFPEHNCKLSKESSNIKNYSLYELFSNLPSHQRAVNAIKFGLNMRNKNYHIFLIGEERSARLKFLMRYLKSYVNGLDAPDDIVYLNNFLQSHRPIPFNLKNGMGKELQLKTQDLIKSIYTIFNNIFSNFKHQEQINNITQSINKKINEDLVKLQVKANAKGFEITQNSEGIVYLKAIENEQSDTKYFNALNDTLNKLLLKNDINSYKIEQKINTFKKDVAKKAITPLFVDFKKEFAPYLKNWIDDFKKDIVENYHLFLKISFEKNSDKAFDEVAMFNSLNDRYGVNLFIDNSLNKNPNIVIESNPTFENIFGCIAYKANTTTGALETNFNMLKAGALHRANGGILVLRAESLMQNEDLWNALKITLKNKKINIYERYREGGIPLDDAPTPRSVALDVQIFLITSPFLYYNYFYKDKDFSSFFKIRAEIDADFKVDKKNIVEFQKTIKIMCLEENQKDISDAAIDLLTAYASRWTYDRKKVSTKLEFITDILTETDEYLNINSPDSTTIEEKHIQEILKHRRYINSSYEERVIEEITNNQVLIETTGKRVGLVNGLTILSLADRSFGIPSRISARTYVGNEGVINIEHLTQMAGPIQQKGAFILEGFLKGVFASDIPFGFASSITFEQNYSDVEGDSATIAELIAILSSLSNIAVRQDIAITGSLNQYGQTQVVGGVHLKVEGFFKICKKQGFTGTQGVIVPSANIDNLIIKQEIVEKIKQNKFYIFAVDNIFDVIEIMFDIDSGVTIDKTGKINTNFAPNSLFDIIKKKLIKNYEQNYKK